jgi:uncharacterized SAM-binding protein YcdF (DUF218 family)
VYELTHSALRYSGQFSLKGPKGMTSLKELLETCLSPVGLVTILFGSGILVNAFQRQSRMGRRLVWSGVGLYLVFLLTPLAEVLYANLEHPYPPMLHPDASVRIIVVLSGYGEDFSFLPVTSKLSVETISRMAEGIRLYREIPGARLILSGGVVRHQDGPIANLMADFARAMGVPNQDIVVEGLSTTTYENLLEVNKIIGSEPFILVTSSGELRRAGAVARRLGMKPLPAPAAIWAARYYPAGMSWLEWGSKVIEDMGYPTTDRLSYLQRAHHEYLGYVWYWMLGRV